MTPLTPTMNSANCRSAYPEFATQILGLLTRRTTGANLDHLRFGQLRINVGLSLGVSCSRSLERAFRNKAISQSTLDYLPHVFSGSADAEMLRIAAWAVVARMHDLLIAACKNKSGGDMHHHSMNKLDAILLNQPILTKLPVTVLCSWTLPFVATVLRNDDAGLNKFNHLLRGEAGLGAGSRLLNILSCSHLLHSS